MTVKHATIVPKEIVKVNSGEKLAVRMPRFVAGFGGCIKSKCCISTAEATICKGHELQQGVGAVDHFVKLSRWPSQLNIPSEYANAFVLDQEHSRIGFHGYMRKADFDALATASRDPAYLDGLQALFAQSIYEGPQAKRRGTAWLLVGALLAVGFVAIAAIYLSRR